MSALQDGLREHEVEFHAFSEHAYLSLEVQVLGLDSVLPKRL